MVGVNFVSGESLAGQGITGAAEDAVEAIPEYTLSRIWDDDDLIVFDASYDGYPVRTIADDDFLVVIEGEIYDADDYERCGRFIHEQVMAGDTAALSDWLGTCDGDFVIYHIAKDTGSLTVLSDALGRLPIFYTDPRRDPIAGGRNLHLVKHVAEAAGHEFSIDTEAVAQTLLLRHPFGRKTLFEEVSKTGPGAFLRIGGGEVSYRKIYEIRFDRRAYDDRSVDRNAANIADRLVETCSHRAELDGDHIVSLSGGKDSRLIAAALLESGCDISAASFYTTSKRVEKDVDVAKDVVKELAIDWHLYPVRNTGRSIEELLYRKAGMNNFAMGFLMEFFEKLREGRTVQYYTGDVGDLLDGGWSVEQEFESTEEAAEWIVETNAELPPEEVTELTGYSRLDLTRAVVERLEQFPETEPRAKVEHYVTRERGMNLDFHGEDRNRTAFWTHAPLNSRPVVEYLINCPRRQKTDYKLYRRVMEHIRGKVFDVDYAPYGAPVGSHEQLLKQKAYERVANNSAIKDVVLAFLFDERSYPQPVADLLKDQLESDAPIDEVFDRNKLRQLADDRGSISGNTAFDLITITTVLEYCHNEPITLESYRTERFE